MDKRTEKNLIGVHPDLCKVITEAQQLQPSFVVVCGIRIDTEQQALYAQGRTAPGLKVTNCDGIINKSNHQIHSDGFGYAVDLYADLNSNGQLDSAEINDVASLRKVAANIKAVAKKHGVVVEWGGDWRMRDYPHIQLKKQ